MSEKYTVQIDVDTSLAKSKITDLKSELTGKDIKMNVDVNVEGQQKLTTLMSDLKQLSSTDKNLDIKVKVDATSIKKQIQDAINAGVKGADMSGNGGGSKKPAITQQTRKANADTKKLNNSVTQYKKAAQALQTLDAKDSLSDLEKRQHKIANQIMDSSRQTITRLSAQNKVSISESVNAFRDLDKITDQYITKTQQVKKFASESSVASMGAKLEKQMTAMDQYTDTEYGAKLKQRHDTAQRLYQQYQRDSQNYRDGVLGFDDAKSNDKFLKQYNTLKDEYETFNNMAKQANEAQKRMVNPNTRLNDVSKLTSWLDKNDNVFKSNYGKQIKVLQQSLSDDNLTKGAYTKLANEAKSLQAKALSEGFGGQKFSTQIKSAFSNVATMVSGADIWNGMINGAKGAYQAVLDVNSAMIDLRKVSDASDSQLDKYMGTAAQDAKDLGVTMSDMITSTAEYSKLGYNLTDSRDLSRITTLYKNVADNIDITEASQSIISTMQGFGIAADDSLKIVDSFNEVANRYAIDSAGLGSSLQRSAASLNAAGNDLDQSIALTTGANTILQDPDSVGTGLKVISMRLRGASSDLQAMGEEGVESTSKLQKELQALSGVDIMKDKNTFKSTYQILGDLANKWKDMTDIQQADICLVA